jgi:hypothetical protein
MENSMACGSLYLRASACTCICRLGDRKIDPRLSRRRGGRFLLGGSVGVFLESIVGTDVEDDHRDLVVVKLLRHL